MTDDGRPSADVLPLLELALALLDERSDHVAGAYVAQAIAAFNGPYANGTADLKRPL